MKTILALAVIISVAVAQNVIFDAAPHAYYGGHLGYYGGPLGYFGNHLASGAVRGYAVWPHYGLGLHPVAAAEEAQEEEPAVEEASRKKRSTVLYSGGLGHLGYGYHGLRHFGYAAHTYAPYAYSHAYAAPYAFAYGAHQIPHGAPYYKVAAEEPEEEAAVEEEPAVEEASRKKRSTVLAHPYLGLGHLGYTHHAIAAPVVPLVKHSYTAAVPVETEFTYKTHSYEDQDKPTPADTTLVALEEEEHTGKRITFEPKVFSYTAPAYSHQCIPGFHTCYPAHFAPALVAAKKPEEESERKKRSVVLAHHGLGHFGYALHPYAAAVPVTTEYKYKTVSYEDTDAPTPADTTLVDAVEKEHTAKAVHLAPAYFGFHH